MANAAAPVRHHARKEIGEIGMSRHYIFWTPPQLMPSDSSSLMEPSCLLQQAGEVKSYNGEKDELTLQRMAPSEPQGSEGQSTTEHRVEPPTAWRGAGVSSTALSKLHAAPILPARPSPRPGTVTSHSKEKKPRLQPWDKLTSCRWVWMDEHPQTLKVFKCLPSELQTVHTAPLGSHWLQLL